MSYIIFAEIFEIAGLIHAIVEIGCWPLERRCARHQFTVFSTIEWSLPGGEAEWAGPVEHLGIPADGSAARERLQRVSGISASATGTPRQFV